MATGTTVNNQQLITFFDPGTTSTNSPTVNVPFNKGVFKVWGTWNGATVTLFGGTPGTNTFIQIGTPYLSPLSFTANAEVTLQDIVWNESMYATISNAGGSTSLYVTLQRI